MNGQVYAVVQGSNGVALAHATNPNLVGKNMSQVQDVDDGYFAKDMGNMGRKNASFWYGVKFVNPATEKVQPNTMYCQSLDQTIVCVGMPVLTGRLARLLWLARFDPHEVECGRKSAGTATNRCAVAWPAVPRRLLVQVVSDLEWRQSDCVAQ